VSLFTGTGWLMLLVLRRDRIKLSVWVFSIVGLIAIAAPSIKEVYGSSQATLEQYAGTMSHSIVGRMLGGPVDGPQLGSVMMMEYFLFVGVLIAFMSSLAIVRHTRQNEETGRSELLGSAVVGRYAQLTAALVVVLMVNLVITALMAVALIVNNMPTEGSLAMASALGGVGIVFAAVAAVCAQIIGSSRGANAAAGAVIGFAILSRGIGDVLGKVASDGMSVASAWPSWLSPIGWGQQMHPFVTSDWWVLGIFAGASILLVSAAFWLASHRDHGMGMIPAKSGRATARAVLLSPLGLAWRLQRTVLLGWAIGVAVLGITLGMTAIEFKDFLAENEQLAAILTQMGGGNGNVTDVYFVAMLGFMAFTMTGYGLQAILRLQTEESNGYVEPILSTATGRFHWALSHLGIVVVSVLALGALAGASTGVSYALVASDVWSQVSGITIAGLVQVPATLAFVGFAVALFGLVPRWSNAITWTAFAACLLVVEVGSLLKLPEWVQNISPFTHTPAAPAPTIEAWPLVVMSAIAVGLMALGLVAFRRRDVVTS